MDDFGVFAETAEGCMGTFKVLEELLLELGFVPHPVGAGESKRSERPIQQLILSGVLWDSVSMTMRLDAVKIARTRRMIAEFREAAKQTVGGVEVLGGFLSWASDMVDGGRIFTQRIWALTRGFGARHKSNRVRLTRPVFMDLDWWDTSLETHNGLATRLPAVDRRPIICAATDATGDGDIGVWWMGAFAHFREAEVRKICPEIPPHGAKRHHVQVWEAAGPLVFLRVFRGLWDGHEVHFATDNTGAESAHNKGAIRHGETMEVVRATFFETRARDARVRVGWIPGISNPLADAVSRLHESRQPDRLADLIVAEAAAGRLNGTPRRGWLRNLGGG